MNRAAEPVFIKDNLIDMQIVNDQTPTSQLTAIQIGDHISNGLGTFGEVKEISFEDLNHTWKFVFALVGGGLIEASKTRTTC